MTNDESVARCNNLESILTEKIKTEQALREGEVNNLKTLVIENDKRYSQRGQTQDEAVEKAFVSAQTAIDKSEANQTKINDGTYVKLTDLSTLLGKKVSMSDFQRANKQASEALVRINLSMKDKVDVNAYNLNNDNLQKQLKSIIDIQTISRGEKLGSAAEWTKIIAASGLAATVIGLIFRFI